MARANGVQDSDGGLRMLSLTRQSIRSHDREQEEEEHPSSSAAFDYIPIFGIMCAVLIPFVTLLYQSDPKNFFDHYTAHLCVFVASIFIFCIAVTIERKRPIPRCFDPKVPDVVAYLSGILSFVSLISMLVAVKYSYIPYVFWVVLLCLKLTWRLLCVGYRRLHAMMVRGEEAPSSPV